MADMAGKVCPNHTDRAAVTRCAACIKPMCGECVINVDEVHFCSKVCANNYGTSTKAIEDFKKKDSSRKFAAFLKQVIGFAILGAILYFGWNYYQNNKEKFGIEENQKKDGDAKKKSKKKKKE